MKRKPEILMMPADIKVGESLASYVARQPAKEPTRQNVLDCIATILPKVKGLWPHEQALEELGRIAMSKFDGA